MPKGVYQRTDYHRKINSLGHKGIIPINKGKRTYKSCGTCGKQFSTYSMSENGNKMTKPHKKFCSRHCSAVRKRGISSWSGFYNRSRRANPNMGNCAFCERIAVHRHHFDYNKPEDVVGVCVKCHWRIHKNTDIGWRADFNAMDYSKEKQYLETQITEAQQLLNNIK